MAGPVGSSAAPTQRERTKRTGGGGKWTAEQARAMGEQGHAAQAAKRGNGIGPGARLRDFITGNSDG